MHSESPVWNLAFRPFFLLAAGAASLFIILWLAVWTGMISGPRYFVNPILWHVHEMIFGFASLVVVGFLMTASQNWTGQRGVHGWRLQLLASVWVIARIMPWFDMSPSYAYAAIDLSFLVLSIVFLAPYLLKANQRRNLGLLGVLVLLALANGLVHAESAGLASGTASRGQALAIGMILVVIVVIGGRIIPLFTRNAVKSAKVRSWQLLDRLSVSLTLIYALSDTLLPGTQFFGFIALVAATVNTVRWCFWDPWSTRHQPILWIMFIGYFWLIVGLFLRGFGLWFSIPASLGIHALTVGAIGVLIYGIMPRVSLGHTGRPIKAQLALVAGFALINASVLVRVVYAGLVTQHYTEALIVSGVLWAIAFGIFCVLFVPILTAPRADGREG